MKRFLAIATLVTSAAHASCSDGFCRPVSVQAPVINPFLVSLTDSVGRFFTPFEGACGQYLVAGGSLNYSTSSYPQYALYDLFAANLDDDDNFGTPTDLSINSENFQNYFWGAYGGYHVNVDGRWDIGIELGYKKLLRTESQVNTVIEDIILTPITPFRNTQTHVWDIMATLKYQTMYGFNLFIKAGGAKVHTQIREGNFISPNNTDFNGLNAFGTYTYQLDNLYPEVEIGAGFRFLSHFEIHISYAKIFGETENDLISTQDIFFRPRKCPSLDIFSVSLELLLF